MPPLETEVVVQPPMSRPHYDSGTNGQFNDEYDEDANEKMSDKHYIMPKRHVSWQTTPIINNLPGSVDDEFYDDYVFTQVDLSMIRNASENALVALGTESFGVEVEITSANCVRHLECKAQQYAWGKIGSNSLVSRLKASESDGFTIQENEPYAELWIGTHPNGMSNILVPEDESIASDDTHMKSLPLVDYVQSNPEMHLGVEGEIEPSQEFDLTFLFKVLSIEKVLSIQAHPDKRLAGQLHTVKPEAYKDPNHKPEMAVALTDDFEAMSGFRPMCDIASNIMDYPEFGKLLNTRIRESIIDAAEGRVFDSPKVVLKKMFQAYMEASEELIKEQLDILISRLCTKEECNSLDKLIMKLAKQFPGDSGVFAPIIFNYLKLKTGDAFYIGANEPHAYIQGEILECMACSDNVVRAGLTPKMKDVETLVKMLTYKNTVPDVTRGEMVDPYTRLYVPPVEDFAIEIVELPPGTRHIMKDVRSPSVILTLNGSGRLQQGSVQSLPVSFGKAAFMSANTSATIIADENASGLKLVRALSNVHL